MNQSKFQALVKRASSQDNKKAAEAQCILALCYLEGNGVVRRDLKRAAELFEAAANRGLVKAKCLLGKCYYYGVGVPQDEKKAAELLEAAAEQGDGEAQFRIAQLYGSSTNNVLENRKKAVENYKRAAKQGYFTAQCIVKYCYQDSMGVSQDKKQDADKQGYKETQDALLRYADVHRGLPEDEKKAAELFQRIANPRDVETQYIFGRCYEEGIGVLQDKKKAVEYYKRAAQQKYAAAQYALGRCYAEGIGILENKRKAITFYQHAAIQGYSDAQYALGLCYDKDGTDNIIENKLFRFFFKWCSSHGYISPTSYALHLIIPELFWSAAKQGHIQAQEAIVRFYKNISPDYIPLGILKAEELHRYFAMRGSAEQQYTLGLRYANGSNISKDEKGAADLLWCAAKRRHAPALDWLHQNQGQGQGQNAQLTAQPAAAAAATQPPNSVVGISTRLSY